MEPYVIILMILGAITSGGAYLPEKQVDNIELENKEFLSINGDESRGLPFDAGTEEQWCQTARQQLENKKIEGEEIAFAAYRVTSDEGSAKKTEDVLNMLKCPAKPLPVYVLRYKYLVDDGYKIFWFQPRKSSSTKKPLVPKNMILVSEWVKNYEARHGTKGDTSSASKGDTSSA